MTSKPNWLILTSNCQRSGLLNLLRHAPRSQAAFAHSMLNAPPLPSDETDAQARATTVMRYLARDVGDRYSTVEAK